MAAALDRAGILWTRNTGDTHRSDAYVHHYISLYIYIPVSAYSSCFPRHDLPVTVKPPTFT